VRVNPYHNFTALYGAIMGLLSPFSLIAFYGTLLGITRDNQLIDGDDDIDVLAPLSSRNAIMTCVKSNTKGRIRIGLNTDRILQLFVGDLGPFDIYFYREHGD
jgi:hypothetical protein